MVGRLLRGCSQPITSNKIEKAEKGTIISCRNGKVCWLIMYFGKEIFHGQILHCYSNFFCSWMLLALLCSGCFGNKRSQCCLIFWKQGAIWTQSKFCCWLHDPASKGLLCGEHETQFVSLFRKMVAGSQNHSFVSLFVLQ